MSLKRREKKGGRFREEVKSLVCEFYYEKEEKRRREVLKIKKSLQKFPPKLGRFGRKFIKKLR